MTEKEEEKNKQKQSAPDLWIFKRSSSPPADRDGADPARGGPRSRAIHIGTCTESTIPARGGRDSLDWNLILFYTEIETINIYIIMIDYIYVQLHIDIYTASEVYC